MITGARMYAGWAVLSIIAAIMTSATGPASAQVLSQLLVETFGVGQAVPCDDFSECTTGETCQADGTCRGTARPDGTGCSDENPCTSNDSCRQGTCVGTPVANGTPCEDLFGACTANDRCQVFGQIAFCLGDLRECPEDENLCTVEFCNPTNGQCTSFPIECADDCVTGQCDPDTGECINLQARPNGTACDDFNECTGNDQCQQGECVGGGVQPGSPSPTVSTPTPTRTATGNQSPVATPTLGPCVGDCNEDGRITIDELIKAVNIALGNTGLGECPSFDANEDGNVTVDELIKGVNAALSGCVARRTVTPGSPTVTRTPSVAATPTGSSGGASVAQRASGTITTSTSAFLRIPNLFSALLSRAGSLPSLGSGAGLLPPVDCPDGGSVTVDCQQDLIARPPFLGPPTYSLAADQCMVTASSDEQLTLNGTLIAAGQDDGDVCFVDIPNNLLIEIPSFVVAAAGTERTVVATLSNVTGSVALLGSHPECQFDTFDLQLTGTMLAETKDAQGQTLSSTEVSFSDTSIAIFVEEYGEECVAETYSLTLNGAATFRTGDNTFEATFTDYRIENETFFGDNQVTVSGTIASGCFGKSVQLSTLDDLQVPAGASCPTDGEILVSYDGGEDRLEYSDEGLEVDLGNDETTDQTFDSCLDPRLFVCPAG